MILYMLGTFQGLLKGFLMAHSSGPCFLSKGSEVLAPVFKWLDKDPDLGGHGSHIDLTRPRTKGTRPEKL